MCLTPGQIDYITTSATVLGLFLNLGGFIFMSKYGLPVKGIEKIINNLEDDDKYEEHMNAAKLDFDCIFRKSDENIQEAIKKHNRYANLGFYLVITGVFFQLVGVF